MPRKMSVPKLQEALAELARELGGVERRLDSIRVRVPDSPERDAMEEGEIPPDLATDLQGVIECVIEDDIRPARRKLEEAAFRTLEDLERQWGEEKLWRRS